MPFLSPARWREAFSRILTMSDGQLRFVGLASILMGVLGLLWLR